MAAPNRNTRSNRIKTGLIQIDGLAELNRTLREDFGKGFQVELRQANKAAAELAADGARARAYSLGGVAGHVAPSIKLSAGTATAGVSFGGPGFPMAGGAEFGALQNEIRGRRTGPYVGYRQFEPWRGNQMDAGYFVYPTIRASADEIEAQYRDALDRLLTRAGLS